MDIRGLLNKAIELAGGSQERLGMLTGYSQNAIYAARKKGQVSPLMARRIEAAVGISADDLCPDITPTQPGRRRPATDDPV
jgi:hypothetical protein